MKLFKSIDDKFLEIGFIKIREDRFGAEYERYNKDYKYTQTLFLGHKNSGKHIVQSYDKDLMDEKISGNIGVGLTMHEMKLCLKKMKKMGWKSVC